MRRSKWLTCLTGCCLAILLGCSSLGCLVTAFSFPTVRLDTVFLWCIAVSLCLAICYTLKLQLIPLCALALLTGYLWYSGSLNQSVEGLLYQITVHYDSAYSCGVLNWSGTFIRDGDVTLALCAAVTLIPLAVCRTVCTGQSTWLAVVASLLPLAACMVVTDLIPETKWLYLLLVGLVLLILPSGLRRTDPKQGVALAAMLAVPVLLAVALLLLAVPRSSYDGQQRAGSLANIFMDWLPTFDQLENVVGLPFTGSSEDETVDLTDVGLRIENRMIIMDVTGSARGTIYLRGQALDIYTGESWTDSGGGNLMAWPFPTALEPAGTLNISTRYVLSTQYVPYYAQNVTPDADGRRMENVAKQTSYVYDLMSLTDGYEDLAQPTTTHIPETYLSLPDNTKAWSEVLLEGALQPEDWENPMRTASAIAHYVAASAVYDLNVSAMPRSRSDFVRWFLEEQDEGYCVHFASAATVLLRAAGIPARYATGYMFSKNGETAVVRGANAHAWAEFWVQGIGWMVLEATPAAEELPAHVQTVPTSEQTTAPSSTEPDAVTPHQPEQILPGFAPSEQTEQTGALLQWLWNILKLLLQAGLAVCLLVFQWKLRFALRQRRLRRGSINTRAVALWQEAVYLSRLLSEQPKSGLFTTAQKAKFSQHTIAPEELAPLETYIRQARDRLRRKPVYLRLVYQLLLAVC